MKKLTDDFVAVVTGANRGLGLSLVRLLCRRAGNGTTVYLTARNESHGQAAVAFLEGEGLRARFHPLDLTSAESAERLRDHLATAHGGLDLLIQNGAYAITPGPSTASDARLLMTTNNLGTARLLRSFRPLLRWNSSVVVVASAFGTLANLPARLHQRFGVESCTMEQVNEALLYYVELLEAGRAEAEGWPAWANIPSKIGQVALAKIFARELSLGNEVERSILVNAACPGWTRTEAVAAYLRAQPEIKAQEPDEAAADVVWLALEPHEFRGALVQHRRQIPWSAT